MSAWVLPDHIADVLPAQARHLEELRRALLDCARGYGYELVAPPLMEHLESLLTGTGEALDLQTFKLVDQLSGRTMGLRADTTPQVARIDAHLLNRNGVARLCYCGPVLHTRPDRPHATREPLQFGAEIYGHVGPEADVEAMLLALDCLRAAQVQNFVVDLADARVVQTLLAQAELEPAALARMQQALATKDASAVRELGAGLPRDTREGLLALLDLYGDIRVLDEAEKVLPNSPMLATALASLRFMAGHLAGESITFDLADLRGYAYYTGARFSVYAAGVSDALVRGGRYDEVGAVFGRNRPAAGFSLDVKELVGLVHPRPVWPAIRAPWREDADLKRAIASLRASGEVVVCVLPGHESEVDEFQCDRQLTLVAGQWVVSAI